MKSGWLEAPGSSGRPAGFCELAHIADAPATQGAASQGEVPEGMVSKGMVSKGMVPEGMVSESPGDNPVWLA